MSKSGIAKELLKQVRITRRRRFLRRNWSAGLVLTMAIAAGGIFIYQSVSDRTAYEQGEAAYQAADCSTAVKQFERFIGRDRLIDTNDLVARAKAKRAECQAFQTIVAQQKQSNPAAKLIAAANFVSNYPDSRFVKQVQQQIPTLFEQVQPTEIAQPTVCDRLKVLQQQNLIPQPNRNLPLLYHACGQAYVDAGNYAGAIALYERFLQDYPQHELIPEVKSALAKTMVKEAQALNPGRIAQPSQISGATTGVTLLKIRNDSPRKIRIVLSGDQPRFEEIEPCEECPIYSTPPDSCPEKGIIKEFTVQAGEYEVVVKAADDSSIRPFIGEWKLADSAAYGSCFYITQQPLPRDKDLGRSSSPSPIHSPSGRSQSFY
jgi:tetratricopeptide (TPR) repeat protein